MSEKISNFSTITTNELHLKIGNENIQIIDIRPVDAYNGWKQKDESRGGHIKGARSLPFKWMNYIDWIEIVRSKGILPENELIIYGYDKVKIEKVALQFKKAGYPQVKVYFDFLTHWTTDENNPMDILANYKQLVSAQWLKELLDTGKADEYNNDKFVLCQAHYRNRNAYEQGHIPGAVEIDTNTLESTITWNRLSPEEIKATLESKGITADTTVILYGRFSSPDNSNPFPGSSAGHIGAIRSAFIMMYAGVKDVRVLNGGLQSWEDAGFATTTQETSPTPVADFGANIPMRPEYAVDIEEAKQILADPNKNLVSIRSWPEFIGEVSGYNYIKKKGRIPGAIFGNCGSDAYHMENYRNLDHTIREAQEIAALWKEAGITPDKHNAFYCGTGWRGSEAWFNAWLMGWPRVSVFDGGWFEWSNDESNPYETGEPKSRQSMRK